MPNWFEQNAPKQSGGNWFAQNAPQSQPQVEPAGIGAQIGAGVTDLAKGALSSAASTVYHGGDLIRRAFGMERIIDRPDVKAAMTAPDSAAGKAGSIIEQGAEFMLPGGLVSRGAKLLQGSGKIAQVAGRAGLEGLAAAGVAGVQTGGDTDAMRSAALTAGGATAAIGGLSAAAPKIAETLKSSALTQYGRVLNPTKEKTKAMAQKVIPEMIERGVKASSLQSLLGKAEQRVQYLGQKIDDVWDKMDTTGVTAQIEPLLQRLDDVARETYYTKDAQGNLKVLGRVAEQGLKELEGIGTAILDAATVNPVNNKLEIPVRTLRDFRQYWDDVANKAGAFQKTPSALGEYSSALAHKHAGDAVRAELAKATPDLAALNKEFSFWKRIEEVTEETMKRRTGQQKPLTRRIAQLAGVGAGASAGGPIGAVLGSMAMDQLQGLITSPAWGTASAVTKDRLANAIAKGSRGEAEFYVRKLASSVGGAAVTSRPTPALQPAQ